MAEFLWLPDELAELLKVAPKTVTRWAAAGRIASIRTPGGRIRIRDSVVRALFTPEGGRQS